ncbi:long-chain-fatty-acid--CoA ligase [Caldinitratiruptor microaerophilus]|uniref:Long-chain-fatty-acid--CoA ligase n=1 Tax=Caldinitratiruptor microaerophilus TaxID=671077 RepID=A0AA35CKC8_9FIRM|nr:long-chain fatty acid--CoA ligase [Caldinitratiruptor microaerophilus]BDG60727.1 long-chain-fatty-acid--CoA ligase [Caldinitratiruptor microaerophilus]
MTGTAADRPWVKFYDPWVRPHLDYPDVPLYAFLDDTAARKPHGTATIFQGARLTWAGVREAADAFAAALAALGVRPGDRVAIMLPNLPQTVITFYGALKAGAVVVMTNPLYTERELEHQLSDSGAETLVFLDILYPRVSRAVPRTPVRRLIAASIRDALPLPLRLLYPLKARREGHSLALPDQPNLHRLPELLARHRGAPPPAVTVRGEDLALLQYTGGTTGIAKGAMLTHRNLVANTLQTWEWVRGLERGEQRVLAVLPFFHVYGLTTALNLGVATGATLILVARFQVGEVLKLIQRYRPTLFPGAPPMYVAINNHPEVGRYDLSSIQACISGAAPLPVEVQTRFEALTGAKLVEGYGLTEASPVTHANPLQGRRVVGSIGVPFPDTDVRIVSPETGEEVPVGQPGELCVRGPQVMQGYWNRPDETARVLRDGWLHTGDVARIDEDGYCYIVDRLKEVIIASGYNIYPREVEEVLYQHPGIMEAAVIGVPHEYRGETVKAYVVPRPGTTLTEEEVIEFCRERLARYKVPTSVEFRDSLPKSAAGKVLRRVLREEALRQQATPTA